jgi:hypothetical protein
MLVESGDFYGLLNTQDIKVKENGVLMTNSQEYGQVIKTLGILDNIGVGRYFKEFDGDILTYSFKDKVRLENINRENRINKILTDSNLKIDLYNDWDYITPTMLL